MASPTPTAGPAGPSPQTLNAILALFDPPAAVKAADAVRLYGHAGLPPGVYADPACRDYPCHTAEAAWLSAARLCLEPAADPERAETLKKRALAAAGVHGPEHAEAVAGLYAKAAAFARVDPAALADDDFALVLEGPQGKERHYRLANANEVKAAQAYLGRYADVFDPPMRRQAAAKVLAKAARLGLADVAADEGLRKQAGLGFCAARSAAGLLEGRAEALARLRRGPEARDLLTKLAAACREAPELCQDEAFRHRLEDTLDKVDRDYRLAGLGLPAARDVLYQSTWEKAADFLDAHAGDAGGNVWDVRALAGALAPEDLEELFGKEAAAAVYAAGVPGADGLRGLLTKLSRRQADRLAERAAYRGVRPVARQPAAPQEDFGGRLEGLAALAGPPGG
jgi:hypothetical protein